MGDFFGKIFWFLVLCGLMTLAFFAYVRWWDAGAVEKIQRVAEQFVTEKTGEVKQQVEQKTKEYASEVVSEAKKTATQMIKEQVSSALMGIGNGIVHSAESLVGASSSDVVIPFTANSLAGNTSGIVPVPTGSDYTIPAPPATFITRVGIPVTFSINRGTTYAIDWGDSARDAGSVTQELTKLVSHTWKGEGDYLVKISVKGGVTPQDYSFPIRVFP